MNLPHLIQRFVQKNPLAGPLIWLSTVQFFITQPIVSRAWVDPPYNWLRMTISELGAIKCGIADGRYMCSPLHDIMNASFITLGMAMFFGSMLMYTKLRQSRTGFTLMAIAGLGAILVGLVPMDTIYWLHIVGADIAFLFGNIALIVFGFSLPVKKWLRALGIILGGIGILGLVLFLTKNHFFLGLGGMERVVAYPIIVWLVACGLYALRSGRHTTAR